MDDCMGLVFPLSIVFGIILAVCAFYIAVKTVAIIVGIIAALLILGPIVFLVWYIATAID